MTLTKVKIESLFPVPPQLRLPLFVKSCTINTTGLCNRENKPCQMVIIMTPDSMRFILFAYLLGTALLAVLFLRRRTLSLAAYTFWGLFALLVPLVGPFTVLYLRPGQQQQTRKRRGSGR